jgi:uncharacterized Zn finger protein
MPSVADLVDPARLPELATPATLRLGREIAAAHAVEFLDFGPLVVRAKVGGAETNSQKRTTELRSVSGTLEWSCTCSRKGRFCKHCVALAIATWNRAPKRRH